MKKLILSFLSVTTIFSAGIFAYEVTQKQEAASTFSGTSMMSIDESVSTVNDTRNSSSTKKNYSFVNDQISNLSVEGVNVYFFFEKDSNDAIFIQNNLLKTLLIEINSNEHTINSIDLSGLDKSVLPVDMKNNWGFENYPSFVQAYYHEDGTFEILNVLEWNKEKPFNEYDLRQWFISVELIKPTEKDEGELIAEEIK